MIPTGTFRPSASRGQQWPTAVNIGVAGSLGRCENLLFGGWGAEAGAREGTAFSAP